LDNNDVAAEFIKPKNELILKTGTGGLNQSTLDALQSRIETMALNIEPFLDEKFQFMKNIIKEEGFITGNDKDLINDFLGDLVAYAVHVKMTKNDPVIQVSGSLLRFAERLNTMNNDAYNVIKAHINTLDIIYKKSLNDTAHKDVLNSLIKELGEACDRYNTKHTITRQSA